MRIFRINQGLVVVKKLLETFGFFVLSLDSVSNWHEFVLKVVQRDFYRRLWRLPRLNSVPIQKVVFMKVLVIELFKGVLADLTPVFARLFLLLNANMNLPLSLFLVLFFNVLTHLVCHLFQPCVVVVWVVQSISYKFWYSSEFLMQGLLLKHVIPKVFLPRVSIRHHLLWASLHGIENLEVLLSVRRERGYELLFGHCRYVVVLFVKMLHRIEVLWLVRFEHVQVKLLILCRYFISP